MLRRAGILNLFPQTGAATPRCSKDGEVAGIQDFAPDEIKAAFEAFRKEPDCPMYSVYDRK